MIANQVDISKALTIGGWMSEKELTWLAKMARKCERIVEFGSFHGRSTRALADNIKRAGIIYAVDPWNGTYLLESGEALQKVNTYVFPIFKRNLKNHIDIGTVIPKRQCSYNFALPFKVDMVFIDGDHRYENVKRDIAKGLSLLKTNGIISGHDWNHPVWTGVNQAVTELLGDVSTEEMIWWKRV